MAAIRLHTGNSVTATLVPNSFIDQHMAQASGEYVKVYLYLLRCVAGSKSDLSISKIADKLEYTEKDIQRALRYWEKTNLLQLEYDKDGELSGISFLDTEPGAASDSQMQAEPPAIRRSDPTGQEPKGTSFEERPSYSPNEIDAFQTKEEELFFVAERYMRRPLTPTDVQTVLYWFDTLGFSAELIEYLIESCVEKGHSSIRYMDRVAISWAEQGIRTADQAKQTRHARNQAYGTVEKSFGISNRSLVPYETDFIEKWMREYGFSIDLISEACKRTIQATHQPSFEYADSILRRWKDSQVSRIEEVQKMDAERKKAKRQPSTTKSAGSKFNNFTQRNYNYEQLERQLLKHSIR